MGFLTLIGFFILIERFSKVLDVDQMILKLCDLITVTVPPSLPAGLNTAILISMYYLKKKRIFCISPNKIITGGEV